MPVTISAKRKLRSDLRKQRVNQIVTRAVKSALKKLKSNRSEKTLGGVYSALDTAVKKGVMPKKRADRKKGRLAKILTSKKPGEKVRFGVTQTKYPKLEKP